VGGGSEREQNRGRPAEKRGDRQGENAPHPAEVAIGIGASVELRETFRAQRTREENSEQQQNDAADLAAQS
jgi:hypothetical protein